MATYQPRPRDEIAERIECYILEHALQPGDRLPSERQLCEAWGCNRMTFRAAAKRLIAEGILENVPTIGYFVAKPRLERYLQDLSSMSSFVKQKGGEISSQLVSQAVLPASARVAQLFQLPPGGRVYEIARVRLVDGEPVSLETATLPLPRFEGIQAFNFEHESLYAVLEKHFGVVPDAGSEEISLTYADDEEASLLKIATGEPLFYLKGLTWDTSGAPVEYLKSVLRTDRIRFAGELSKE